MGKLLGNTRYVVFIAVVGLLFSSIAVYVFSGILTVNVIVEAFQHGFNTEVARAFSSELIELIDLFLLGTVLFMTSVGLYELFVDPKISIPAWLSVANLDQLKFNLVAVIVVMLMVLFLGAVATAPDFENGLDLLYYGGGIALVILAGSVAVLIFQRVHQNEIGHEHMPAHDIAGGELNEN
ncbi:MAG: YqhA family protein [Chloroflexota bacterium]|nr:MAG: YqhA family protein [Chloroflexota bacterium]